MLDHFENIIAYNKIRFYSGLFKAENSGKQLTVTFLEKDSVFKLLALKVFRGLLFSLT